jgi:hypothetical protein
MQIGLVRRIDIDLSPENDIENGKGGDVGSLGPPNNLSVLYIIVFDEIKSFVRGFFMLSNRN